VNLERSFEVRLDYVRSLTSQLTTRLAIQSWQHVPEHVESIRHELTTLVEMWADIKAKRESEVDKVGKDSSSPRK
jgi:head-tail adaptor